MKLILTASRRLDGFDNDDGGVQSVIFVHGLTGHREDMDSGKLMTRGQSHCYPGSCQRSVAMRMAMMPTWSGEGY